MQATADKPAEVKKEAPRARRYHMRANANAGKGPDTGPGAFNGVCMVYEGDTFYLTIPTIHVKQRGADGKFIYNPGGSIKTVEMDGKIPTWCDPIAEYPLDTEQKPLRTFPAS